MVPWRAVRVGATQSNWSTPRATASSMPTGSPTPIRYRGRSLGEMGHGGGQRLEHRRARLPHRQAADAVAVEVERHRPLGALGPEPGIGAALDDPEQGLALRSGLEAVVVAPGPRRPSPPCGRRPGAAPRSGPGGVAQTSSTIWMSAPISPWASTADSGVSRTRLPS